MDTTITLDEKTKKHLNSKRIDLSKEHNKMLSWDEFFKIIIKKL